MIAASERITSWFDLHVKLMANQTSNTLHEVEEAPLLYEMEFLQPVPSSVINLAPSLSIEQDQTSLVHQ